MLAVKLLLNVALHLIHPVVHLLICGAHCILLGISSSAGTNADTACRTLCCILHVLLGTLMPSGATDIHMHCGAQCCILGVEMQSCSHQQTRRHAAALLLEAVQADEHD